MKDITAFIMFGGLCCFIGMVIGRSQLMDDIPTRTELIQLGFGFYNERTGEFQTMPISVECYNSQRRESEKIRQEWRDMDLDKMKITEGRR